MSDDQVDSDYRQSRVDRIEEQLEAEIRRYERTLKIYVRLDKATSIALAACSISSLVLTSGTMGSACTGVGIVASLPLGSLACVSATATMVLSLIVKRLAKKKKKHRDTVRLARSYKSRVEAEVNKALANDDVIDDIEFPMITRCLKDYYDEKERLRQPSTTFSEDLNAHTS